MNVLKRGAGVHGIAYRTKWSCDLADKAPGHPLRLEALLKTGFSRSIGTHLTYKRLLLAKVRRNSRTTVDPTDNARDPPGDHADLST